MNHKKRRAKLSRKTAHRVSLLRNLSKQIIYHETIKTTLKKAKFVKPFVEKIISISRENKLNSKKKLISILGSNCKEIYKLSKISHKKYTSRKGGYTRIFKSGSRKGDSAPMGIIELV